VRFVPRGPCPSVPTSSGGRETSRAVAFFAEPANADKRFGFSAYKSRAVKQALEQMFGGKCAYCETDYAATAPPDVEHYRPKGSVLRGDGSIKQPGYYWLAATWSNLLPSCIDCNREREQAIDGRRSLSGKACRFPVADETARATAPGEESREQPLLLDPTTDTPDDHLEFIDGGVVRPRLVGHEESVRGRQTIDVLGLRRMGLTRRRAERLRWVDLAAARLNDRVAELAVDPTNDTFREQVRRELKEIRRLVRGDSEYALMASQRVRELLPDIDLA
jgi:uncharacterized protein (TIGR02646 family)